MMRIYTSHLVHSNAILRRGRRDLTDVLGGVADPNPESYMRTICSELGKLKRSSFILSPLVT
jgi:hypothetical protein